ncbi:A-kinase anchor protein 10, mitochondrial [Nymphon striatum]|nr:A-kinase anchor protein 10, mitochondrial [Nymphon striatum]
MLVSVMPLFKKKHERTLSLASSSGSTAIFESNGGTSTTNSEIDLTFGAENSCISDVPNFSQCLSMSSYNEKVASILSRTKSRLSKSIQELVNDHSALAYFIQYLDSCKADRFIKFWLDAESFLASTVSRSQTLASHKKLNNDKEVPVCHPSKICDSSVGNAVPDILKKNDIFQSSSSSIVDKSNDCNRTETSINIINKVSSKDEIDLSEKLGESIQKDAISIYTKYISQDASHPIGVSDAMRNEVIGRICSEDGEVDATCFNTAQEFVINLLNENVFHYKHQIDLLTSGSVYLADILYNDAALFYFMEFMEIEGAQSLMEFWLASHHFQEQQSSAQKSGSYVGEIAQGDAMVLYDKYFSLQAISPLGFDDEIRFEIEQNICTEAGPDPECFQKPVALVLNLLETVYHPPFLKSQLFYKYLSELANIIQGRRLYYGRKKRSGSESSGSEHSGHSSNTNTLLAMDGTQPGVSGTITPKFLKNIEDQDMRIDMGKFNNPSDLWRRDLAGKLQIGKMSDIGQFTTEFLPQPDVKGKSKISKAVKRFVNKDQHEKDEDVAWQVAEMIVRDVCSVTMNNSKKNFDSSSSNFFLPPKKS